MHARTHARTHTPHQVIAPFKNRDPGSDDEAELLANLFAALCACLMTPENRSAFVDAEARVAACVSLVALPSLARMTLCSAPCLVSFACLMRTLTPARPTHTG